MIRATIKKVFRKTNNVVYGYRIEDEFGNVRDVTPKQLSNDI